MPSTASRTLPSRISLRALAPVRVGIRPVRGAERPRVTGPSEHPLVRHLADGPAPTGGPVDLLTTGDVWTADSAATLLPACERPGPRRVVLVHSGAGGGSLLRGLAAERPGLSVGSIELREPTPAALCAAAALLDRASFTGDDLTVHGDGTVTGVGWEPVEIPAATPRFDGSPVIVTGGLGGLGVRMAASLARAGATPILADVRPAAEDPPDTRTYLAVLRRLAPGARTVRLDLTDAAAVAEHLGRLRPVAIVHCAGRVAGGTGRRLDVTRIQALVSAKVDTLRNVVAAVRPDDLRAVLAFGSITAHGAHPGLSGYALANELLRREMARLSAAYTRARWCTAEWSLWSGAGMARGVARTAARALGMVPVPVTTGIRAATSLLAALVAPDGRPLPRSLLVAGAIPGAEGTWAGRPEGLPGIEMSLAVPPDGDLSEAVRTVIAAVAEGHRSGVPFLVRAAVQGDRVDCVVRPAP